MSKVAITTINEEPLPPQVAQQFPPEHRPRMYEAKLSDGTSYAMMLGREPIGGTSEPSDFRWHMSIAHDRRIPEWGHIVEITHRLRPGVMFAIGIPPKGHYLSIHDYCLHVWELHDDHLTAQWRHEAKVARAMGKGQPT